MSAENGAGYGAAVTGVGVGAGSASQLRGAALSGGVYREWAGVQPSSFDPSSFVPPAIPAAPLDYRSARAGCHHHADARFDASAQSVQPVRFGDLYGNPNATGAASSVTSAATAAESNRAALGRLARAAGVAPDPTDIRGYPVPAHSAYEPAAAAPRSGGLSSLFGRGRSPRPAAPSGANMPMSMSMPQGPLSGSSLLRDPYEQARGMGGYTEPSRGQPMATSNLLHPQSASGPHGMLSGPAQRFLSRTMEPAAQPAPAPAPLSRHGAAAGLSRRTTFGGSNAPPSGYYGR
jgi:hypothetical protein